MTPRVQRIAVLGGSRFIGHAIVEALLARGHRVTTVNRGIAPARYSGPVARVRADRRDPAGYARALSGIDADGVVDVTAYRPGETRVAIDAFAGRVGRFVHISTLSVYRFPFACPVGEEAPLETEPLNAYGFHKAACERLIFSEPAARLPWTVLRLPAVFGPRDPASREAYLLRQILKGQAIVVPPRPYLCQNLYVADAAGAVCGLIESPRAAGRAYNAGGEPFTLEAYVDHVARVAGRKAQMLRAAARVLAEGGADPQRVPYFFEGDLVMDTRRIRDETGFSPAWATEKALAATLDWFSGRQDPTCWGLPGDLPLPALPEEMTPIEAGTAP